ncbi:hypothetical protein B0T25DRAFT_112700 [Lasiosphaeria hispida]|uniref:Uncharacterized protein n=1 Tax=Lasiosphaeria hispida TaxID=260671 RepID=A0AAJ0HR29_9PEZI|nr:hypothetical protein B0T25DRAFT_112700 [Lasiosphaeria hispida]
MTCYTRATAIIWMITAGEGLPRFVPCLHFEARPRFNASGEPPGPFVPGPGNAANSALDNTKRSQSPRGWFLFIVSKPRPGCLSTEVSLHRNSRRRLTDLMFMRFRPAQHVVVGLGPCCALETRRSEHLRICGYGENLTSHRPHHTHFEARTTL